MGYVILNLVIGLLLIYIAFAKQFRPMSWTRFWINVGLGAANLFLAVVGLIRLLF